MIITAPNEIFKSYLNKVSECEIVVFAMQIKVIFKKFETPA